MPKVLDRIRGRASAPVPSFPPPPPLFPTDEQLAEMAASAWVDDPADAAPSAPGLVNSATAPVFVDTTTLERALAISKRLAPPYAWWAACAKAASGNVVWIVPSRAGGTKPDRHYLALSADDAPSYTALEDRPLEVLDDIVAVRVRVERGGLDPDAAIWRAYVNTDTP